MSDMGGKRTGYCIVDCSKLDTVTRRMLLSNTDSSVVDA